MSKNFFIVCPYNNNNLHTRNIIWFLDFNIYAEPIIQTKGKRILGSHPIFILWAIFYAGYAKFMSNGCF